MTAVTENGETTTYAYDELSQPVSVTYPDGSTEYSEYDSLGNIVKQIDENGDVTTYGYTVENMVSRVTNADGSSLHYAYDKAGNLIRETDADGGVTRYTYDILGQLTNVLSADGTTTEYEYNEKGEVVSELISSIAYSGENDGENHYSTLANTSSKPFVATAIRYAYDTTNASKWPDKKVPTPQPKKPAVSTPKTKAQEYAQARRQATVPTQQEYKELLRSGYTGGYSQYERDKRQTRFPSPTEYFYNKQQGRNTYQTYGPLQSTTGQINHVYDKTPNIVAEATPKVESIDARLERGCNAPGANTNALGAGGNNHALSEGEKEFILGAISVVEVAAGLALTAGLMGTGLWIVAGGALFGAGISSLVGGIVNKASGGSFGAGWLGGEISGFITGAGSAAGATYELSSTIVRAATIGTSFFGGSGGNLATQLADTGGVNWKGVFGAGILNTGFTGVTKFFNIVPNAITSEGTTGMAEKVVSTTMKIINEAVFDSASSAFSLKVG